MKLLHCEQRSPQWYASRLGKPTASRYGDVLGKLKNGGPNAACTDYCAELVLERISGELMQQYVTPAMARGVELEESARQCYMARTGELVEPVGLCLHDTINTACSPDGFVNDDGLLEIKCPMNQLAIADLWLRQDPAPYLPQIQGQLWITDRKWCDLVIYDPRLARGGMDMLVIRVPRDEAYIESLAVAVRAFEQAVTANTEKLRAAVARQAQVQHA